MVQAQVLYISPGLAFYESQPPPFQYRSGIFESYDGKRVGKVIAIYGFINVWSESSCGLARLFRWIKTQKNFNIKILKLKKNNFQP